MDVFAASDGRMVRGINQTRASQANTGAIIMDSHEHGAQSLQAYIEAHGEGMHAIHTWRWKVNRDYSIQACMLAVEHHACSPEPVSQIIHVSSRLPILPILYVF